MNINFMKDYKTLNTLLVEEKSNCFGKFLYGVKNQQAKKDL